MIRVSCHPLIVTVPAAAESAAAAVAALPLALMFSKTRNTTCYCIFKSTSMFICTVPSLGPVGVTQLFRIKIMEHNKGDGSSFIMFIRP